MSLRAGCQEDLGPETAQRVGASGPTWNDLSLMQMCRRTRWSGCHRRALRPVPPGCGEADGRWVPPDAPRRN